MHSLSSRPAAGFKVIAFLQVVLLPSWSLCSPQIAPQPLWPLAGTMGASWNGPQGKARASFRRGGGATPRSGTASGKSGGLAPSASGRSKTSASTKGSGSAKAASASLSLKCQDSCSDSSRSLLLAPRLGRLSGFFFSSWKFPMPVLQHEGPTLVLSFCGQALPSQSC